MVKTNILTNVLPSCFLGKITAFTAVLKLIVISFIIKLHFVKSVHIRSFLIRIQSECGKIRTKKTPNTDTFHAVLYARINSFKIWYIFSESHQQRSYGGVLQRNHIETICQYHRKTLIVCLFFNKVTGCWCATLLPAALLKRNSSTGVFLGFLRNFSE